VFFFQFFWFETTVLTLLAGLRDQIGLRGKCLGSRWNELTLCPLEEGLHVWTTDCTEVLGTAEFS
jgi:hypothetical protein